MYIHINVYILGQLWSTIYNKLAASSGLFRTHVDIDKPRQHNYYSSKRAEFNWITLPLNFRVNETRISLAHNADFGQMPRRAQSPLNNPVLQSYKLHWIFVCLSQHSRNSLVGQAIHLRISGYTFAFSIALFETANFARDLFYLLFRISPKDV